MPDNSNTFPILQADSLFLYEEEFSLCSIGLPLLGGCLKNLKKNKPYWADSWVIPVSTANSHHSKM